MANVKITDLTAYTDPLNTDVLPIVDVTNNVTKKVSIANMAKNVSLGTAALPGVAFDGDPNTGIYSPGADQLAISTGGTGRVFVNAAGLVDISNTTSDKLTLSHPGFGIGTFGVDSTGSLLFKADEVNAQASSIIQFKIDGGEKLRIDSSGNAGLGVTPNLWGTGWKALQTPAASFSAFNTATFYLWQNGYFDGTNSRYVNTGFASNYNQINGVHTWQTATSGTAGNVITFTDVLSTSAAGTTTLTAAASTAPFIAKISSTEVARIDSSGRLLVGTGSDSGGALFQVNGDRIRIGTAKTPASASATGTTGEICWDANYIYVCTATNTWKRTAIATW